MSTKGLLSLLPHDHNRRISWAGTRFVWGSVCIKRNIITVQKEKGCQLWEKIQMTFCIQILSLAKTKKRLATFYSVLDG